MLVPKILTTMRAYDRGLNVARAHLGLATVPRPEFAVPTVAREDRRHRPRPPG